MYENKLWHADLGDGTYRNPILYEDFSDPDAIRVGDDYYMVASSFCNVPGIPILHSRDLVNWRVVNYVLRKLPSPKYDRPAHGHGIWAPAIRYHDGMLWVCFPMPDEGIFFSTAANPLGEWSEPFPLREGSGWIDPCPFWDDDGRAYMVSAFAKSRIGIKSIINLVEMRPDGTGLIDDGKYVFDGRNTQPTIEGPKLYKRNGYYYILAPAGGVKHGWQTALRSRNIWGPYEEKIVMMRGDSEVNGPHQGALVDTPDGEWWFLHFQDVGVCGRIVHLQPVQWVDDWPVIGIDAGNEGWGVPVINYKMPIPQGFADTLETSLVYNGALGLQWQWNANPQKDFCSVEGKRLNLYAQPVIGKLCDASNLLLQKFAAPAFTATSIFYLDHLAIGDVAGMVVLGGRYGALCIKRMEKTLQLLRTEGEIKAGGETVEVLKELPYAEEMNLRLDNCGAKCELLYSADGQAYTTGFTFMTSPGVWVGAKHGVFCIGEKGFVSLEKYNLAIKESV